MYTYKINISNSSQLTLTDGVANTELGPNIESDTSNRDLDATVDGVSTNMKCAYYNLHSYSCNPN